MHLQFINLDYESKRLYLVFIWRKFFVTKMKTIGEHSISEKHFTPCNDPKNRQSFIFSRDKMSVCLFKLNNTSTPEEITKHYFSYKQV